MPSSYVCFGFLKQKTNLGSPVINGKCKTLAANFANSHEFFFQSAKIRAIRGKKLLTLLFNSVGNSSDQLYQL